jgi:long-chain acyl-CoA synthetase
MLQNLLNQSGTKTFLQVGNQSYSYQWLQQRIGKIRGLFQSLALKPGDRLLLAVSDDVEMSTLFLAALASGMTVVMADPEMKGPRARAITDRSEPSCIIADKNSLETWKLTVPDGCRVIPLVAESAPKAGLLSKFLKKNQPAAAANDLRSLLEAAPVATGWPQEIDPAAIAYIIFTSGTTADSKGVAITYGNLQAHLQTLVKVYGLDQESRIFNQLILCHADGCIQGPVLAAFAGCSLHRPYRFSMEKIPAMLDYCFAHNISHVFMVPAMLNMLVQFADTYEDSFNYPEFKALISVSAHLEAPLWDKFESIFKVPITNVYGLTETVAGSLFCGPSKELYRKYTVGKPVDCSIRIVNNEGEDVSGGETGELLLQGPHLMKAYWRDEMMTKEAYRDGWFYTGDLAAADADGYITIKGRKKNLIISGGINIQPEEVTECLLSHPEIGEACALGLPDQVFGERLAAAVVLKPGSRTTALELVEHCRQLLEEKKVPHKIWILPSLPKGVSGKVQLEELKTQLKQQHQPVAEQNGHYADEVIHIAAEAFQVPAERLTVKDNSNTVSGWDSLAHLTFITALEEKFKTRFSTAEVITMNSIQRAVDLLKQKNGQS